MFQVRALFVGVVLAPGCGSEDPTDEEGIVGSWQLIRGGSVSTYDDSMKAAMVIDDDLGGALTVVYCQASGTTPQDSETIALEVEPSDDGTYDVSLDGGYASWRCTLSGDALDCNSDVTGSLHFERVSDVDLECVPATPGNCFDATGTWVGSCDGDVTTPGTSYQDFPVDIAITMALSDDVGAVTGIVSYTAETEHVNTPGTTGGGGATTTTTGVIGGTWTVDGVRNNCEITLDVVASETTTTANDFVPVDPVSMSFGLYDVENTSEMTGYLTLPPDEYGSNDLLFCEVSR